MATEARWRAHARAALVALHLFAITVMGMPSVGSGMNRAAWANPTVQEEFALWTERLQGWGVAVTTEQLQDTAWAVASGYESGRKQVLAPFAPYFRYCGTWQSWRMFVAPHRYPGRLAIDIRSGDGKWSPIYRGRSNEHEFLRGWLDHDRSRAAVFRYSWKHYGKYRRQFADWVAEQTAPAYPDADQVRVAFLRYRTPTPEQALAGDVPAGKRELSQIRELGPLR